MIEKEIETIKNELDSIKQSYLHAEPGGNDASIYSFVYLMMVSSWIEECRNDLSLSLLHRCIAPEKEEDLERRLRQINGFKFADHFKKAFSLIAGHHGYVKLRALCDQRALELLESSLGYIWSARCEAAHKTFEGMSKRSFRTPTEIEPHCINVFDGLINLEKALQLFAQNIAERPCDATTSIAGQE